ncbi:unnamed protein product [Euphydryas editha]|uniref:Uncharacterized protein n=1 Tax=Euphydryas editha TaxID=104508 RepID=A0AAU9TUK0_EUPED|nr:unnamed protein product [Euphydryas editha]
MKSSNIRFEKDIRKKPVIIHKEEYYELYRLHGEIKKLGEDWNTLDIKSLEEYYKKVEAKKQDVNNLMKKQFGDDWSLNEEFRWYKDLVHNETHPEQESDHEDFACDCNEEEANNILV